MSQRPENQTLNSPGSVKLSKEDLSMLKYKQHKNTEFGVVAVVNFKDRFPYGWTRLKDEEGIKIIQELKTLLSQWSIVAFSKGKLTGSGYQYRVEKSYGKQCGEGFIVKYGSHL